MNPLSCHVEHQGSFIALIFKPQGYEFKTLIRKFEDGWLFQAVEQVQRPFLWDYELHTLIHTFSILAQPQYLGLNLENAEFLPSLFSHQHLCL
jgi:hypothetical protein